MPGASSRRWSPTTSTSAARTPSRSSSAGGSSTAGSAPPRGRSRPRSITRGTEVTINAFYRHSRIKQYLKDGRALRIETVINSPTDLRIGRRLHNLGELQDAARAINARLLHTERAGQGCVLANPVFERIAHPSSRGDGRRATAMRFGDSRVQALAGALCSHPGAVTGITNRSLRALMTGLLGTPYTMTQASYDLARLRPQRANHPPAARQHLRPDPRRPELRHLLHQGPRPGPGPALYRRPATGTAPAPRRPPHHRAAHRHAPRRRQAACGSLRNSAQLSQSSTQRVASRIQRVGSGPVQLPPSFRHLPAWADPAARAQEEAKQPVAAAVSLGPGARAPWGGPLGRRLGRPGCFGAAVTPDRWQGAGRDDRTGATAGRPVAARLAGIGLLGPGWPLLCTWLAGCTPLTTTSACSAGGLDAVALKSTAGIDRPWPAAVQVLLALWIYRKLPLARQPAAPAAAGP